MQARKAAGFPRRSFLIRSCQGAAVTLLRGFALPFSARAEAPPYHLHPHYRAQTPLEALFVKTQAGLDEFTSEKEHDRIAAVLNQWSAGFLDGVPPSLAPDFQGFSARLAQSRVIRSGPAMEIRQVTYSPGALAPDAFIRELRDDLAGYSKILTAEFQVARIDAGLRTRVRYDLVAAGAGFHREQRVGYWDIEWTTDTLVRRWQASEETRSRSAAPWFADITAHALGRNPSYSAQLKHGVDYWRTVLDGACGIDIYGHNGVSVGDIDNDGFDDLYVCQPAGLPNRLYRNRGDGTFDDITESSGVGVLENTACALFADFDNDGRQDLVVVRATGPVLFLNQGNGKFLHKPDAFHFAQPPQGTFTGAAAADYDRDGLLDIYFCLYTYYQGADQYRYPAPYYAAENGPPNFLMRNNGDGTFRDVTAETGLNQNNTRYSFCCAWNDYNQDGWPDLYVVNDFGRKNLYRNKGDGAFTDVAVQAGVEDVGAGMGVCWFDYDNDGMEDLYVANMWTAAGERVSAQDAFQKSATAPVRQFYRKHAMGNSLFRNTGAGFQDVTGRTLVGMGRWSWSCDAWDFDHDGYTDLYIANGMLSGPVREDLNSFFWRQVVAKSPSDAKPSLDYEQGWNAINELIRSDYTWNGFERNVFYANNHDGSFSDVSGVVGLDFIEDSRSFALADFDGDGRLEVAVKNRSAPQLRLLKNVAAILPPAISFRLGGTKSNRDAIGAVITIETDAGSQMKSLQTGSGFLSQHSKDVFFGLGDAKGAVTASIRWPSGLMQKLSGLPANHRVIVYEGGEPRFEPFRAANPTQPSTQSTETLPDQVETWLISPVAAPVLPKRIAPGTPALVTLVAPDSPEPAPSAASEGLQLVTVRVDPSSDFAASYNILYRYLFDRHRDLGLPTSFLIDAQGQIVKVYQGPVDPERAQQDCHRIHTNKGPQILLALPFPGVAFNYNLRRNQLSIGSVFFQHGYPDQAEGAFQLALHDDPLSAEAYYGLGSVYLQQGKNAEARASFEQATELSPGYPDTLPNAWNNLGLVATREGHTVEAIRCFQEALRVSPGYWTALENLGNAYRLEKRWPEARETLERAVAAKPQDAEANYNLAMVFAQADDPARAEELLRRALLLRPTYPEAINNLGILYLRTRRRDAGVAQFEECIRVAPQFDQSYLNLARVYNVEGNPEKARSVLLELLRQHPGHAQAQRALAAVGGS